MSALIRAATRRAPLVLCALALLLLVPTSSATSTREELDGRAPTAAELVPSVEAAFAEESYRPGATATLVLFGAAPSVTLQLFRAGAEPPQALGDPILLGAPVR